MVLESLIQDDRKLSLDCCHATITKKMTVEIPDEMYGVQEVQAAIKLGFVKVVGEPPAKKISPEAVVIPEKKLKNVTQSKISLDCVKGLVMPGCYISIPVNKIDVYEVQNAIQSGWLVDEENPLPQRPVPSSRSVIPLEELTSADVNDGPSELHVPGSTTVKKLNRSASSDDDFFKPSQIYQAAKKKGLKGAKAPAPDQPSKIQIVPKGPMAQPTKPKAISEELVDFLATPAEATPEADVAPMADPQQQSKEAEKPSEADDPLGFLLS